MNKTKKPARLLVVDDEERNRRLLVAMLEAEGYVTLEASDGAQALDLALREPPDLVLLDVMMPGMDGYEVARALKTHADTMAIPVVIVTALDDKVARLRGLEAGAEEFITKPVDRNELRVRVRNLLRLKEFGDSLADHNRILDAQVRARVAQLQSESAFRESIIERMTEGLAVCHDTVEFPHVGFSVWNARMTGITGYTMEQINRRGWYQTMYPDPELQARARARMDRMREGDDLKEEEWEITRADGATRALLISTKVLRHDDGRTYVLGLFHDVTERKRAEEEVRRHLQAVQDAFMSTVEVSMNMGELRDPYTAGHERRVAAIAVAIGAELGFDARRQEGIRVAGYLHDIGKIGIPSDILSRPGKLSAAEFSLIKGHPQAAYDILGKVKLPWPVADIALQHHERIDGSGYPRGLKGEEILLEARILAVADVVEAMASHRPYRSALGIDKALAEIERGRGTSYDGQIAEVCLRLFREKGYTIPPA